jgi:hypothetical protein
LLHFGDFIIFLASVENVVFRLMIYELAVGGSYWLVIGVMSAAYGMMKVQTNGDDFFHYTNSTVSSSLFPFLRLLSALLSLVTHVVITLK